MSITELSVLPHGTRVKVKRGRVPSAPGLLGQTGVVVEHSTYTPHLIEVSLDGDPRVRGFSPDEVEVMSGPAILPVDKQDAKRRLARP